MTLQELHGWLPAAVGYHWSRGPHAVSTYQQGAERGYIIWRAREEIARVVTWADVERVCDRRRPS